MLGMSVEEDEKETEREVNSKQKCPNCGHRRIEFIGVVLFYYISTGIRLASYG
jgi:hypothetical protein